MFKVKAQQIFLGQRVHCILYGGNDGIVVGIRPYGNGVSYDVAFPRYISKGVPESIVRGVQWRIYDEVGTADDILDAIKQATDAEAMKKLQEQAAADRRQAERDEHARNHPELLQKKDRPNWPSRRLAAENIRRALKKAFPGIKFSVTSKSYSGGNHVDVCWTCGPTVKAVEPFVNRHEEGSFNGMEDLYEYNADATFSDVFGGTKYASCHRGYSDEAFDKACRDYAAIHKVTAADLRSVRVGNSSRWLTEEVRLIIAAYALPNGLNGIRRTGKLGAGNLEEFYEAY